MANLFLVLAMLASFFFFFIDPIFSQSTQQEIDRICGDMEDVTFCQNTFHQNLKDPNSDIAALTQITIEQATTNATNTHTFINGLLEKAGETVEKNALVTCENSYRLVMTSFDAAALAFFEKRYEDMLDSEINTPRAHASCTTIFNTPPNPPNPITDRNIQMRILINMAIAAGTDLTSSS